MSETRIGYARCSTDKQDLAAQRVALLDLDVAEDRIYTDHGLTGTNRERPGLAQALAAVREGDTLVVPKLDRLARSVRTPAPSPTSWRRAGSNWHWEHRSTIRPIRWAGCSSTSWPRSPSSRLT